MKDLEGLFATIVVILCVSVFEYKIIELLVNTVV